MDKVFTGDLTYQQALARPTQMLFVDDGEPGSVTPTTVRLTRISDRLSKRVNVNRRDVLGVYQKMLAERQI